MSTASTISTDPPDFQGQSMKSHAVRRILMPGILAAGVPSMGLPAGAGAEPSGNGRAPDLSVEELTAAYPIFCHYPNSAQTSGSP